MGVAGPVLPPRAADPAVPPASPPPQPPRPAGLGRSGGRGAVGAAGPRPAGAVAGGLGECGWVRGAWGSHVLAPHGAGSMRVAASLLMSLGLAMAAGGGSRHAVPAHGLTPLLTSSAVPRAMAPAGGRRAILGTCC